MTRWLSLILLVSFSVGWVVPLSFSMPFLLDWRRLEVSPAINGAERQVNSFPFLAESERLMQVGIAWLAWAALFWSYIASRRWLFAERVR